jgi:hypothetical protein
MKHAVRGFRYALEALQRKREWELEAARLELAETLRVVKRTQDHLDALEIRFAAARHEWSRRAGEGHGFDLHWQRVASAYLAELTRETAVGRAQLEMLQAERDKAMEKVGEAHLALEALTRHRAQEADEHARVASLRDLALADEGWLHRVTDGDPA